MNNIRDEEYDADFRTLICQEVLRHADRLNSELNMSLNLKLRCHYDLPSYINNPSSALGIEAYPVGWWNPNTPAVIHLNCDYVIEDVERECFIKHIIPHEVAHAFTGIAGEDCHGDLWKSYMQLLGRPPLITWTEMLVNR